MRLEENKGGNKSPSVEGVDDEVGGEAVGGLCRAYTIVRMEVRAIPGFEVTTECAETTTTDAVSKMKGDEGWCSGSKNE